MRTVLCRAAGRASLILVTAGMVGSAAFPAVPAAAGTAAAAHSRSASTTQIGTAVKYVRYPDGTIHQVR